MSIEKTEIKHEFSGNDVTGKNFIETLKNSQCYRITLESEKSPSIEFCDHLLENYGFALDTCKEYIQNGKTFFETVFVREPAL